MNSVKFGRYLSTTIQLNYMALYSIHETLASSALFPRIRYLPIKMKNLKITSLDWLKFYFEEFSFSLLHCCKTSIMGTQQQWPCGEHLWRDLLESVGPALETARRGGLGGAARLALLTRATTIRYCQLPLPLQQRTSTSTTTSRYQ